MAATKSKSQAKGKDTAQHEAADAGTTRASATSEGKKQTMSEVNSVLEFSEDISNAEPPVPLPVGDYPAEIRGAEKKTSQRTGNDYIKVDFFVAPENYPADYTEGNPDGEILSFMRLSAEDTPRARHRMRKFCEAIGAPTGTKVDLNGWVGLTATVSIAEEEYEGEKRAVIAKVGAA
jgi:hypothetical protein